MSADPSPTATSGAATTPTRARTPSAEARLPATSTYVPSLLLDAGEQAGVRYRVCSTRGEAKRRSRLPRQDAVALSAQRDDMLDLVVADGVSGAHLSHRGASLACHFGIAALGDDDIDWLERIRIISWGMQQEWIASTQGAQDLTLEAQLAGSRDAFATTIVAVRVGCVDGALHAEVGALGDSTFFVLGEEGLEEPLPPPEYEHQNLTDALPSPPDRVRTMELELPPGAPLIICTDGIARPLARLRDPHAHFTEPPETVEDMLALVAVLRDSFGDDQTLVVCWPTGEPAPDRARTRPLVLDADRMPDAGDAAGADVNGSEPPDTAPGPPAPTADAMPPPPPPPPPPTGRHIDVEG